MKAKSSMTKKRNSKSRKHQKNWPWLIKHACGMGLFLLVPVFLHAQEADYYDYAEGGPYEYPVYETVIYDNDNELIEREAEDQSQIELNEELQDHRVKLAVITAMRQSSAVPASGLEVEVVNGIATITGDVPTYQARQAASRLAAQVRGVRDVENRIAVLQTDVNEDNLETALERALSIDPRAKNLELDLDIVNGNTVNLEGTVRTWNEYSLAEEIVAMVPGIIEINNNLKVTPDVNRDDDEIRQDVLQNIRWSTMIERPGRIAVQVNDGTVMLQGAVPSLAAKERVRELASVPGAVAINTDSLLVEPSELRATPYQEVTELGSEAVIEAIARNINQAPFTSADNIEIDYLDGVATLSGGVGSLAAKVRAQEAAYGTRGVYRVRNFLNVQTDFDYEQNASLIQEQVDRRLENDYYVGNNEIDHDLNNGVVTLRGTVDSKFEKKHARQLVSNIDGILQVNDKLRIDDTAEDAREDWELSEDIMRSLVWNSLINAQNINAKVENGTVILQGSVPSWYQRQRATEVARDAGAENVRNLLRVPTGPRSYAGNMSYRQQNRQ